MVRFLSPEWVQALDGAAVSLGSAREGATVPVGGDDEQIVVAYDVEGFGYRIVFSSDGMRVHPGTDGATVTIRLDRATAADIARGELSAQRAFMGGRLRLGGDATALVRAQAAIATLPDLFAAVRSDTEW